MKLRYAVLATTLWGICSVQAEPPVSTNVPPDPFRELPEPVKIPDYEMKVDRTRGAFTIPAADGQYFAGSHFANWLWNIDLDRWGQYYVGLVYESSRPKLGVQLKVGSEVLKGYAGRTSTTRDNDPLVLGTAYLSKTGEHALNLLTGEPSNEDSFKILGIHFQPAPESPVLGQSIDGTVQLEAKTATTYSEAMRYEPQENKNCLGYWTEEKDWAEWLFDVNDPGKFQLSVIYGCGGGNEGSEVAVMVNGETFKFNVEDTGGFQSWKTLDLGEVELEHAGEHKIAIVPLSKKAKAVMDVQRLVLTPKS